MNKTGIDQPRVSRRTFVLGAGLAAAGLIAGKALWEPYAVEVRELPVALEKIAPGRELRLVHISDLHIRTFQGYFAKVAALVGGLKPDIILLTGDYLEQQRNIWAVRKFLGLLEAPRGVFAVQGNWEYWSRLEGENLRRHFAQVGTRLLINERFDLGDEKHLPLSILGLDYPSGSDDLQKLQQTADPSRLNLLLSHVPAFDHQQLDGRIDLILSGHTHGGQIRIPWVPPFYLPRFSGRFVQGLYQVGPARTPLYVTRGIGTSLLPVRFLCRPEITLIKLQGLKA